MQYLDSCPYAISVHVTDRLANNQLMISLCTTQIYSMSWGYSVNESGCETYGKEDGQ